MHGGNPLGGDLGDQTVDFRFGADVNAADVHGRTPLMMAAMHDWPEALRALLDAHANIKARDRAGHTILDFVDLPKRKW